MRVFSWYPGNEARFSSEVSEPSVAHQLFVLGGGGRWGMPGFLLLIGAAPEHTAWVDGEDPPKPVMTTSVLG